MSLCKILFVATFATAFVPLVIGGRVSQHATFASDAARLASSIPHAALHHAVQALPDTRQANVPLPRAPPVVFASPPVTTPHGSQMQEAHRTANREALPVLTTPRGADIWEKFRADKEFCRSQTADALTGFCPSPCFPCGTGETLCCPTLPPGGPQTKEAHRPANREALPVLTTPRGADIWEKFRADKEFCRSQTADVRTGFCPSPCFPCGTGETLCCPTLPPGLILE